MKSKITTNCIRIVLFFEPNLAKFVSYYTISLKKSVWIIKSVKT